MSRRVFAAVAALCALGGSTGVCAQRAAAPEIVARAAWKAMPANEALMRRQTPSALIVHHTDTTQARDRTLEAKLGELQSFSTNPGALSGASTKKPAWGDVPYHYYIDVSGRIGEGRSLAFAGDTNTGYDTRGYIQVVVEGKFETEMPDPRQLAALDALVAWLAATYKIPPRKITAHSDHAPSHCPGRNLEPYLEMLRSKVAALAPR